MASLKAALGGGGGVPIGGIIEGALDHDSRFIRANGARYLVSMYPNIAPLIASGQLTQYLERTSIARPMYEPHFIDPSSVIGCVDGNRILLPTRRGRSQYSDNIPLITLSTDGGVTWQDTSLTTGLISAWVGSTIDAGWVVTEIVKVSSTKFVAILGVTGQMHAPVIVQSLDAGLNWRVVLVSPNLTSGIGVNGELSNTPRLLVDNTGNKLLAYQESNTNMTTHASYDGGDTWVTSAFANASGFFSVETDGTNLFYGSGTSLMWCAWPASGTITPSNFTTVASKFPNSTNRIKKLNNRYIAFNAGATQPTMNISSSTTLTGTYTNTALTTFANGILYDIGSAGSLVFFIAQSSGSFIDLFYATDSAAISTATRRSATADVPAVSSEISFSYNARFFKTYGAALSNVYTWFGYSPTIAVLGTSNGTSFNAVATTTPCEFQTALFKQGSTYFASKLENAKHAQPNYFSYGRCVWLKSTDLNKWHFTVRLNAVPVKTATHYIAVNTSNQITRSTDGLTWSTSGVTQPNLASNAGATHRLWHVGDVVFVYSTGSSEGTWVSTNNGATWQSINMLNMYGDLNTNRASFWFKMSPIAFFGGRYHLTASYNDGTNKNVFYSYSADGVNWVSKNTNASVSDVSEGDSSAIVIDNKLFLLSGARSASSYYGMWSTDGYSFYTGWYSPTNGADMELLSEIVTIGYLSNTGVKKSATKVGADTYVYLTCVDNTSGSFGVQGGSVVVFKNGVFLERLAGVGSNGGVNQVIAQSMIDDAGEIIAPTYNSIARFSKTAKTFQVASVASFGWDYVGLRRGHYMKVAD